MTDCRICYVQDLGVTAHAQAYDRQMQCVQDAAAGNGAWLLLCEHPAVLTLGRLADRGHVLAPPEELARRGVDVRAIDRGGEVTLHSPGQLVAYAIMNLNADRKDLHNYLHQLEEVTIDLLSKFGIVAGRISGKTGVWAGEEKIASIGIGVKKWVTYHGLAINVNTDLSLFGLIRPCGLDVRMTSVSRLKGGAPFPMAEVKSAFIESFCRRFGFRPESAP